DGGSRGRQRVTGLLHQIEQIPVRVAAGFANGKAGLEQTFRDVVELLGGKFGKAADRLDEHGLDDAHQDRGWTFGRYCLWHDTHVALMGASSAVSALRSFGRAARYAAKDLNALTALD